MSWVCSYSSDTQDVFWEFIVQISNALPAILTGSFVVFHIPAGEYWVHSRLGGVVVSVLATGPKGCRFEPGQGSGFLRTIKIRSTCSTRMGSKAWRPHVIRFYSMLKNSWSPKGIDRLNSHFLLPSPTAPEASLVMARVLWLSSQVRS
jgi:hypothetical protein